MKYTLITYCSIFLLGALSPSDSFANYKGVKEMDYEKLNRCMDNCDIERDKSDRKLVDQRNAKQRAAIKVDDFETLRGLSKEFDPKDEALEKSHHQCRSVCNKTS